MGLERKVVFVLIGIFSVLVLVYLAGKGALDVGTERFSGKKIVRDLISVAKDEQLRNENTEVGLSASRTLRWVDEKTGQVLFDVGDIVRFDWEQQIFELSRRKAMDLLVRRFKLRQGFTVYDGSGVIYQGAFMSPLSSAGFLGPTIMFMSRVRPPLFRIDSGYPLGPGGRDDIRFSERMKVALAMAGVLEKIDLENPPLPIESVWSEWVGGDRNPKVSVWLFPETFRLGEPARMHLDFCKGQSVKNGADVIECSAVLKANRNKFKTSTRKMYRIKKDLRSVYVFEFMSWGPSRHSPDSYAMPGPAEISVEVVTRKALDEEAETYSPPIDRVKIKPMKLTILPKRSVTQPFALDQMHLSDWVAVQNRLKTRLIPLNKRYVIGRAMKFRLEMTNVSRSPVEYMVPSSIAINDPMIIKGPKGMLVPYIGRSYRADETPTFIKRRQTVTLFDDLDVASLYHIVEPGRYAFQFHGIISSMRILSNILKIDIEPGEPSPGDKIVERLFFILPDGWKLRKSSQPFATCSGVGIDHYITICFKHAAIYIRVSSMPEEGSYRFMGELLGQSRWGPVYVEAFDVELLWPDYREQIIKALDIREVEPD